LLVLLLRKVYICFVKRGINKNVLMPLITAQIGEDVTNVHVRPNYYF